MVSNTVDQWVALLFILGAPGSYLGLEIGCPNCGFSHSLQANPGTGSVFLLDMYEISAFFLGTQDIPGSVFCLKVGNLDYHDPNLFVNQNHPLCDTLFLMELIYCNSLT
jgi:hypothetical protein